MVSYIFILCPPFSGSTVLWKLVSTSEAVSALPKEGQLLPETRGLMRNGAFDEKTKLPWREIKSIWNTYWDLDKPLLIEKSPPNLMQTADILLHFSPVYFLIMVRNPYAFCEGFMRRSEKNPRRAAKKIIKLLRRQAENARTLEHGICITYEELTDNPQEIAEKIESFIPEIGSLDYQAKFKARSIDGVASRELVNYNQKKLDNLSPKSYKEINKVFKENLDVLEYWGYELYSPPRKHWFMFLITRVSVLVPLWWTSFIKTIKSWLKFLIRKK